MTDKTERDATTILDRAKDYWNNYRDRHDWTPSETLMFFAQAETASIREEVERLRAALADAIRSPMGVCPDSATGLLELSDLFKAENRRKFGNPATGDATPSRGVRIGC